MGSWDPARPWPVGKANGTGALGNGFADPPAAETCVTTVPLPGLLLKRPEDVPTQKLEHEHVDGVAQTHSVEATPVSAPGPQVDTTSLARPQETTQRRRGRGADTCRGADGSPNRHAECKEPGPADPVPRAPPITAPWAGARGDW